MEAKAIDEGLGRPILVIHGGMGDSSVWAPVTDHLRDRFRTVRLHRRQYRLDLPGRASLADEVEHVAEVARGLDKPLLVGHSSGAVLALEAMVAEQSLYCGAVLYEPPVVIGEPLDDVRARAAFEAGKPGRAFGYFLSDAVGMNSALATMIGVGVGRSAELRPRIERQLDDNAAINALGVRLDAYAGIALPILLVGGDKSPRHLSDRLDALERVLPQTRRLLMHGQAHNAERSAPGRLAQAITKHYATISPPTTS